MKKIIKHNNDVIEIILENEYLKVHLVNTGASIFKIYFNNIDIIVGPKDIPTFIRKEHYYGKTVGRFSGRFPLNFKVKELDEVNLKPYKSENGAIHGGVNGYSTRTFKYIPTTENEVLFTLIGKEEDDNLPGDISLNVKYVLNNNELIIYYEATTTKTTILNLTNHAYFNLDNSKTIYDHSLEVPAKKIVHFDDNYNILGLKEVKNTLYDFNKPIKLKKPLKKLKASAFKGLDTIYLLDEQKACSLYSNKNKTLMEIYTNYPSLVVYTHNSISPDGLDYYKLWPHVGVALECEYEPGGTLYDFLSSSILNENETYKHYIKYKFILK